MVQKHSQATLTSLNHRTSANVLNNGLNTQLTVSCCKVTTLKGTAWN